MSSSMKIPVRDTNINEKTIRMRRGRLRQNAAQAIRHAFIPDQVLTVHWDGKIVPHLTERDSKQNREAVIVTGKTTVQLLGCFAVNNGTAKEICTAVVRSIQEWDIVSQVKAMSFDTTSVNAGSTGGAAVLIGTELNKDLLWLPCRHHIYERVLADVYHSVMGPSSGPEIMMFKRFASNWRAIDQTKRCNYMNWKESRAAPSPDAANTIKFAVEQIEGGQPRDDYLELLELSIIFLGGVPSRVVRFRAPGPVHSARWMANAIYGLKMTLFKIQLVKLKIITEKEAKGLLDISIFIVTAYIKAWFTAPLAIHAPVNDLTCLQALIMYENINKPIARVAQHRFSCHLWYLSEVNVGFALFDDRLTNEVREAALNAMKNCKGQEEFERKRFVQFRDVPTMSIADFVAKRTMNCFHILGIETSFFDKPVSQWKHCVDYRHARTIVRSLQVTNDHAERAVNLMADFNKGITRDERSFQDLLVNVQNHRKSLPNEKKRLINKKI